MEGGPVSRCPSFGPAFFLIPLLLLACPRLQPFRLLIILPKVNQSVNQSSQSICSSIGQSIRQSINRHCMSFNNLYYKWLNSSVGCLLACVLACLLACLLGFAIESCFTHLAKLGRGLTIIHQVLECPVGSQGNEGQLSL